MVYIYKKLRTILFPSFKTRDKIEDKIAEEMADKTYEKSKIKETADPNLNDLDMKKQSPRMVFCFKLLTCHIYL